jgi:outer membrane receptor protein involved in Fe transport
MLMSAAPAAAQTESTQADAAQVNTAVECSTIADPAERQKCVETQGTNALPEGGAPAGDEIVVTGSRIKRPNFETLQPSVVIDSGQIEARGFETLGQAINEQPSFGVPGASPVGGQAGSFGSGQSFVNFLGLGSQRTLTLVNGRRFVSSNTASIFGPTAAGTQVDLNAINTKLVDRVETIAIGGAPIYGSDAIAGTVNVILKRDYEGIDLDGQMGISSRGDARNWRVRGLAGKNFADGRANVTISGEYNEGKGLVYNDRAITRRGMFEGDCPPDSQFVTCVYNDRRIPSISENGTALISGGFLGFGLSPEQAVDVQFFNFGDADGNGIPGTISDVYTFFGGFPGQQDTILDPVTHAPLQFDQHGNLVPVDFGTRVGGPGSFNIDFSGGNGFNLFNTQQMLTDSKRANANLLAHYQVTDNVRAFVEGWYSYSKGTNLREQPVYNSGLFDAAGTPDGNIIISLDNPFLSPQARDIIEQNIAMHPFAIPGEFELGRANTDIISGRATSTTNLYRIVGGFDGGFNVGDRKFNWELVLNYGHSKTKGREPTLVQQNFENAVNSHVDANGNIVCAGTPSADIETLSPNCLPFNPFGSGNNSPEVLDYFTAIADPTGINKQFVATASLDGALFRLPGGDLSFALGAEYRKESTSFDPGAFFFGGDDPDPATDANGDGDPTNDRVQFGRSVPILPVSGSYHTKELFGEVRAPIIGPSNDVPGIRSLELHGAARIVDHNTAGTDTTYTIEGRWGVIRDIAFRGNFTHAIRAPAITEVFNPSSTFFGFATDPCDAENLENGPDPATRQANCLAAGLDPTFQSTSAQASFHQASAGNVELKNERSNAWSVGTIITPRFIPGLTISADYLDIKLKDAITSLSATSVVNGCYDSPDFPNNDFCGRVHRDEDGNLDFIQTSYFNAAEYHYQGILGSLDYRARTPFLGAESQVGVNLSYQYLKTLEQKSTSSSAAATIDGSIGYPHHSAVLNLNYQNKGFGLFTSFNYTGKVEEDPDAAEDFYEYPTRDAVVFVNGGVSMEVGKRFTMRFVVDNIFDTKPPFPSPAGGGLVSYFPGVLGRYMRVGADVHF